MISLPTSRGPLSAAPDWRNVGLAHWPKFKASISATIATPAVVTDATTTPGGAYFATLQKFLGGVLLPDGRVFCAPFNQIFAHIYDPVSNTITPTGNISSSSYQTLGAVLLKNNNVYLPGSQGASKGFEYNYATGTIITPTGLPTSPSGSEAYAGGVLMSDGRVFLAPSGALTARIYNPATQELESPIITNGTFTGTANKYFGAVLLNDGNVFLIPRNETVGKTYNPVTNTIIDSANTLPAGDKYLGGVLLLDGRVFCVPFGTTVAKIFNPSTNLFEADITGFGSGFIGGVLLPNGNVFCVPFTAASPKIYNPTTGVITTASGSYSVSSGWTGGVLLDDGRVFCVPHSATTARIYGGGTAFNRNVVLSAHFNKL